MGLIYRFMVSGMDDLIIHLSEITAEIKTYRFIMQKEWWIPSGKDDPVLSFLSPVNAIFKLYRAGERLVLEGKVKGTLEILCDRCLSSYSFDIDSDFRIFLSTELLFDEPEIELHSDDMDTDFVKDNQLNAEDVIREQIYLSIPYKCLCSEECKGLCPSCGKNLNTGDCNCTIESGHPGFMILKGLRNSLPSRG